jgi:hypothetical protein
MQLRQLERAVVSEAREWSLDWHREGGRLSALELLAAMQHFGVPSRMLDFTFNPVIALWFAVQGRDEIAGRVFAIDIAGRQVETWQEKSSDLWWWEASSRTDSSWATKAWVWRPPPLEARISRQEACFVMGGVPSTIPRRNYRAGGGWKSLRADEVRKCMSIPFQLIGYSRASNQARGIATAGAPALASAFTIRVTKKTQVRRELEQVFGYSFGSLFPDFPGFARYARSFGHSGD